MLKNRILTAFLLYLYWWQPSGSIPVAMADNRCSRMGRAGCAWFYKTIAVSGSGAVPFTLFGIAMTIVFIFSPHIDFAYLSLLLQSPLSSAGRVILRRNKSIRF